ncbi:hypothetical protein C6503_04605 [Candidatus Poribacteria bacterium]|nr:MAG: hypothetical protein C6503_04605 [Candidatus Poribacteria bacterium]
MPNANLKQQALTLIEQLPAEKLGAAVDYLTYLYDKAAWEATYELMSDLEIVKALEQAEADEKAGRLTNWNDVKREV